jgi:hypothetical protein
MKDLIRTSESILISEIFQKSYEYRINVNTKDYKEYLFYSKESLIQLAFTDLSEQDDFFNEEEIMQIMNLKGATKVFNIDYNKNRNSDELVAKRNNLIVNVDFKEKDSESFDLTNKNDSIMIFSTIINIIQDHSKKYKVFGYLIEGSSDKHTSAYESIIKYMVKKNGYDYITFNQESNFCCYSDKSFFLRTNIRM